MIEILTALIDENNCIGCSKCIRVCPTDAIVGSKHLLHTIIPKLCTSCEECINCCPTNCINLSTPHVAMSQLTENQLKAKKLARTTMNKLVLPSHHQDKNAITDTVTKESGDILRKQQIADAIARVKARKINRLQ